MRNTDTTKKTLGSREGQAVPASYKTPAVSMDNSWIIRFR